MKSEHNFQAIEVSPRSAPRTRPAGFSGTVTTPPVHHLQAAWQGVKITDVMPGFRVKAGQNQGSGDLALARLNDFFWDTSFERNPQTGQKMGSQEPKKRQGSLGEFKLHSAFFRTCCDGNGPILSQKTTIQQTWQKTSFVNHIFHSQIFLCKCVILNSQSSSVDLWPFAKVGLPLPITLRSQLRVS